MSIEQVVLEETTTPFEPGDDEDLIHIVCTDHTPEVSFCGVRLRGEYVELANTFDECLVCAEMVCPVCGCGS